MTQQFLDIYEDVIYLLAGRPQTFPAVAGPNLRASGWRSGTLVMYASPTGVDEFVVEKTDGSHLCGLLVFPSEDYGDKQFGGPVQNYTGMQFRAEGGVPAGASCVTVMRGAIRALFRNFETLSLDANGVRTGPPITYSLNEWIRISENGLLCNDSAARLVLAGVAVPLQMALCNSVPASRNGNRLGIDFRG